MSQIVSTPLGRFRRCTTGDAKNPDVWLFECPGCKQWVSLDADQFAGRISVDHAADGCPGKYHETHNYGAALVASIQAAILMGQTPYSEDA